MHDNSLDIGKYLVVRIDGELWIKTNLDCPDGARYTCPGEHDCIELNTTDLAEAESYIQRQTELEG